MSFRFLILLVWLLSSCKSFSKDAWIDSCKCVPGQACWEKLNWTDLETKLGGSEYLEKSYDLSPLGCEQRGGKDCWSFDWDVDDVFSWQAQSWANITLSRYRDFDFAPNKRTVAAINSKQVAEAILFAKNNKLKVVVKSGGHDYKGRSQDPEALLIWTHRMRDTEFKPGHKICGETYDTLIVESGARWLEVYNALQTTNRYVPGGAANSVGVAGFTLGGGYSLMAKKFGPTAGYVREMEVVTPDGAIKVVNACNHPELFMALKGSGNASYGVVTKFVFETIEPFDVGFWKFKIDAKDDESYRFVIRQWLEFYLAHLDHEDFGSIVDLQGRGQGQGGVIWSLPILYTGRTGAQMEEMVNRLREKIGDKATIESNVVEPFSIKVYRSKNFYLNYMNGKESKSDSNLFYLPNNGSPTLWNIAAFESLFLERDKFNDLGALSEVMFKASQSASLHMQLSKALNGSSEEAKKRVALTSVQKQVLEAPVFMTIAGGPGGFDPGAKQEEIRSGVQTAFGHFLTLFKEGEEYSTYGNQSSGTIAHWQSATYGKDQYENLLRLKKQLDPNGLFRCRHCVGDDLWDEKGCKVKESWED